VYLIDYICDQIKQYYQIERNYVVCLLFIINQFDNFNDAPQSHFYASMIPKTPLDQCIDDFFNKKSSKKLFRKIFLGALCYFQGNPQVKMSFLDKSPLIEILRLYMNSIKI
jgi:hypothetical protein